MPDATSVVQDPRARHFWDARELLGKFYERALPTPGTPSWDVYLLFPPGVRWTGSTPPKPSFWMHQLGGITTAPHLDPEVFAMEVERFHRR